MVVVVSVLVLAAAGVVVAAVVLAVWTSGARQRWHDGLHAGVAAP